MHRAYTYIVKDGSHMTHGTINIDEEIMADSITLFVFRRFVNSATPQDLMELFRRDPFMHEFETIKFMQFYLENIYYHNGEIFDAKSEEFIEEFARLARANERTQDLSFTIMACAPVVPSWSGEMLDWLKDQDIETLLYITNNPLRLRTQHPLKGASVMVALCERYADFEAIKLIAYRIFEQMALPVFEELMACSDEKARRRLVTVSLYGILEDVTPSEWLATIKAEYSDYPYPIVDQFITRYTALLDEMQTA